MRTYSKKTQNIDVKELQKIEGGNIIIDNLGPSLPWYPPHKRPVLIVDFPFPFIVRP